MRFCAHCGVKLGLCRESEAGKEFCTKACLAQYRESVDRLLQARMRQWWHYLYGQRP